MAETDKKRRVKLGEGPWANLPNELLCEISSLLFAGDRIIFQSVCRSWKSVVSASHVPLKTTIKFTPPYLMLSNTIFHPIYERYYSSNTHILDTPKGEIHVAKDGWFLITEDRRTFFFNPSTKVKVTLPDLPYLLQYSFYFSSPPTTSDWVVVAVVEGHIDVYKICTLKCGEKSWSYCQLSMSKKKFKFSSCCAVYSKGLYYFLGQSAKLLIHYPKTKEFYFYEAPEFISHQLCFWDQQYMLESDGYVLAVFVGYDGRWIHTCQWNVSTKRWETLASLGSKMLFVSRTMSFCEKATIRGTGNKIYFPKFVGEHCLFYSLSTNRYHTFEMGSSYENFLVSKSPTGTTWYSREEQLC